MSRGLRVLLLSLVALAAVVAVRPPSAPPLYDGLGFPDEPYRWVAPAPLGVTTATGTTPPATDLSLTVTGRETRTATTAEQGPQLALSVDPTGLTLPGGAATVTLKAVPQSAPPPPVGGTVVSNLYRWTVTADRPGDVRITPGANVFVNLRADVATTQAVVVQAWNGSTWGQLPTRQVGTDVYAARLVDWSPIALVKLDRGLQPSQPASAVDSGASGPAGSSASSAAAPGTAGGSGSSPQQQTGDGPGAGLWVGLGAVLVLVAAGLLLARRRAQATDRAADDADPGQDRPHE